MVGSLPDVQSSAHQQSKIFSSKIFTYEDAENAIGLTCHLSGESASGFQWLATSTNIASDLNDFYDLFQNESVMSQFDTGDIRSRENTRGRLLSYDHRQRAGQPHSGMTIKDFDGVFCGFCVAGGGDGPGVSEIAYALLPSVQGKKVTSNVVQSVVTQWAPEVQKHAFSENSFIQSSFRCFGDQPLKRIDSTASPSNIGSWKVLEKNGFCYAKDNVDEAEPIYSLDSKTDLRLEDVEAELRLLFDVNNTPLASNLEKGKRYVVVGIDGTLKTISHSANFDRLKYHYELDLSAQLEKYTSH